MKKYETIWHYLLLQALENKQFQFTQQDIAKLLDCSLSTVNHALETPGQIGAIRKASKYFILADPIKLLYFWASRRQLARSILYQTYSPLPILEMESQIPPNGVFAGYSAGRLILGEPPADYAKLYFYLPKTDLEVAKQRFPPQNGKLSPNVYVLEKTSGLMVNNGHTTLPQTFVDLWNLSDWYARDFYLALEEKIHGLLS